MRQLRDSLGVLKLLASAKLIRDESRIPARLIGPRSRAGGVVEIGLLMALLGLLVVTSTVSLLLLLLELLLRLVLSLLFLDSERPLALQGLRLRLLQRGRGLLVAKLLRLLLLLVWGRVIGWLIDLVVG